MKKIDIIEKRMLENCKKIDELKDQLRVTDNSVRGMQGLVNKIYKKSFLPARQAGKGLFHNYRCKSDRTKPDK